jgi:hypothetical protein
VGIQGKPLAGCEGWGVLAPDDESILPWIGLDSNRSLLHRARLPLGVIRPSPVICREDAGSKSQITAKALVLWCGPGTQEPRVSQTAIARFCTKHTRAKSQRTQVSLRPFFAARMAVACSGRGIPAAKDSWLDGCAFGQLGSTDSLIRHAIAPTPIWICDWVGAGHAICPWQVLGGVVSYGILSTTLANYR